MASDPRPPRHARRSEGGGSHPPAPDGQPLAAAFAVLQSWLEIDLVPGVAAVVARDGRLVGELYAGYADGPRCSPVGQAGGISPSERPVEAATPFCLGSLTALYSACAGLTLVQDGLRGLDEPLGDLLPELAENDRAPFTLRRLLTHTTGLPLDLGPTERERLGPTPDYDAIVREYVRAEPVAPPGTQVRYSNLNLALLALAVGRAAGEPFGAVLQRRVFEPLALESTTLLPSEAVATQLARVAGTDQPGTPQETYNSAWWRGLGLPFEGATAPAREVARFLTGCLTEAPIAGFLSPVMLELMTHNHTPDLGGGIPGLATWPRADWGLGCELRGEKRFHPFGELTSPETFGHLGTAGGLAWADPASGLVCVVLTNRVLARDLPRRLAGFCRFSNAVAAALSD